jgi:hypothetical protein
MGRKTKEHIQVLQDRLKKRELQLNGARAQRDDPGETARLQDEIASIKPTFDNSETKMRRFASAP